jgi:phosphoribosyl 1,2-cyclic phosphate phosphodiesterase
MNLKFLGTGPCSGIFNKTGKSKRTRSSIFIHTQNLNILIDASPDFLLQIRKNKIKQIGAILITHPHFDAYGGLKQLTNWLKAPIPIYCQKQTWQIIKRKFKQLPKLKFNAIIPYKIFKINKLPILPLPIQHSIINEKKFPTLAYKIQNLIYCSDVKFIPQKSRKYFHKMPHLILDAAMYFKRQIFSHLNTRDAIELAQNLKIKNLYLTQIGHSYPSHQIAQQKIYRFLKQNNIRTKTILAFDGLKIKL